MLTHYIVVRDDLPLGFLAAQIVHAAGESHQTKVPPNTNAVVLAVRDEASLYLLKRRLDRAGVEHVAVHETDPSWNGAFTAIGIAPVSDRKLVRSLLGSLPLLGQQRREVAA